MQINYCKEANKLTVALNGRLDTITAPELEKKINEIFGVTSELILDMTNLGYISSAGLRVLLNLQKKMQTCGKMTLIGVNDIIMEVFEITGFSDIFSIE